MKFNVSIVGGNLVFSKELKEWLNNNEGLYSLEFINLGKVRNNKQNKLYWKLIKEISKEIGESEDKTHKLMRYKFLGQVKENIYNENITELPSTQTLSVIEFNEYLEKVINFAKYFLNMNILDE